jgi:phosphate transport system permease protein
MQPITGGRTVLAGSLTMTLLILPIIIVATREALRAVPDSLRQAGMALGATRWQVVREQVFPLAFPGMLTGTILALSRAIGETAPLITVGALTYIAFLPPVWPIWEGLRTPFTVMPIQIFNWVSRPQEEFHSVAATGIIILMVVLLLMNSIAIFLRNKFQKKLN